MLKVVDFIMKNSDWENILQDYPYFITIKRKENFIMFNYNQISSDFRNPIVRECRGLILEDKTFRPLCVPFYKFGNYGESYADKIDWKNARVQEKVDGSLIKIWNYDSEWRISTNGMIDARDAGLPITPDSKYINFYDLFMDAVANVNLNFDKLDVTNTYLFELTSPFNKVVIYYNDITIRHLGTRNNITLRESDIDIGINKPKTYGFKSLNECVVAATNLPFNEEGYVVVDTNWNRIKIKSPAYVAVHHLLNGTLTDESIISIIRKNEQEEFLTYYPEYTEKIRLSESNINNFIYTMEVSINNASNKTFSTRKEYAEFAKTTSCPPIMFNWYDKRLTTVSEWIWGQTNEKIVRWTSNKKETLI